MTQGRQQGVVPCSDTDLERTSPETQAVALGPPPHVRSTNLIRAGKGTEFGAVGQGAEEPEVRRFWALFAPDTA